MLVIVVAFAALGVAAMQPQTSSAFTRWLRTLGPVARLVIGSSADLALRLTRWVTSKVGEGFADMERLAVGWIGGLAEWAKVTFEAALLWPIELLRFAFWLLDVELPRLIRALPNAATRLVHQTITRVVRVERTVVKLPKLSRAQARALVAAAVATYIGPYLFPLRWLRSHFHALTAVIPHTLPIPFGRTITAIRKRLRRLERVTAAGVGVGLVAVALTRLGLKWIRCGKVMRAGRRVCGMDDDLLTSLLGDTLLVLGAVSVVEFAEGLLAIEDEALSVMGGIVRELRR